MKNGLLLIDKQPGCTSHDVVQQARRRLGQRKIGHCGTLDPSATGLLVLTLGRATRLTRFLINAPKVYGGTIRFGIATDTYDAAGQVTAEEPIDGIEHDEVAAGMRAFEGELDQAAPPYSAKKVKGVKYYELARRGEPVPEAKKRIKVFEFAPVGELEDGRISFNLGCSSGTYVRSLAHDLGNQLGCGAHLESLRRERVGPFDVADALDLDGLAARTEAEEPLGAAWIPIDEIPLPFHHIQADAQQERRILNGQTVLIQEADCQEGDWIQLMNQSKRMIAVGSVVERIGERGVGVVRPRIVFR